MKKKIIIIMLLLLVISSVSVIYGDTSTIDNLLNQEIPTSPEDVGIYKQTKEATNFLYITITSGATLALVIVTGFLTFQYVVESDDSRKDQIKRRIKHSIIGFIFCASGAIITFVTAFYR